jgi:hypothetical protein
MMFVAGQIVVWIVVAVIFGFIVGWLARGRGKSQPKRRGFR